jgi:hypothetical protein
MLALTNAVKWLGLVALSYVLSPPVSPGEDEAVLSSHNSPERARSADWQWVLRAVWTTFSRA